jgi:outer membrane protein assembly factor BamB
MWTRDVLVSGGSPVVLAGVGRLVALGVGDEVQLFQGATGAPLPAVPLAAAGTGGTAVAPATVESGTVLLVWARGTILAVDQADGRVLWSVPALGLPAVPPAKVLEAINAPVLVPEDGAFVSRDARTGAETGRSTVDGGVPAGGRLATAGPVVVYGLPDRVIGYR